MQHVVILGAGFAGLSAAQALQHAPVRVTLADQHNYHGFQPLFYQVATAGLEPADIAHNVRDIFHDARRVDFRMGEVKAVDRAAKTVHFADGTALAYDTLVVATGAVTGYFGVEGAAEHSFGLKSVEDAVVLRNHVLTCFEQYNRAPDEAGPGALTFVVVGGGPTGVELSGALVELFRLPLRRDYKGFDAARVARVVLVERGAALLEAYPPRLRDYTRRVLERRGVQVRTGEAVARVERGAVVLESGERIATDTLVWAAGVAASPVADLVGTPQTSGGRLAVQPDLTLPGDPDVFAIGDIAAVPGPDGKPLPQLAPVAMQQGRHVARQLARRRAGQPLAPFHYKDRGTMATIGRNAAVADLYGRVRFKGWLAWLAWLALHIVMLVGFRNRANVLVNWAYNYFTYDRGARLILVPYGGENPGVEGS